MKDRIQTDQAPQAIGAYSQAIKVDETVYLSGQIPLDPQTMTMVSEDFTLQADRVFANIKEVVYAAGARLEDVVKLTVYLTDLTNFPLLNDVMMKYFSAPYPARSTVQVSALPKGAQVEVDAIVVIKRE